MKKPLIAASILSADFAKLGEEVNNVIQAGSDWIHIDIMDGHFVPNITIGPLVVESIHKNNPSAFLDVHLMIENSERYIEQFIKAGAGMVSIHQESNKHLHKNLQLIKDNGAKAAVVINPATAPASIETVLGMVDMVLLMSVNPGFGGQKFIPEVLEKCKNLNKIRSERGLNFLMEVDGGVNESTASKLIQAGVDVLVAGNAIFKTNDYKKAIATIRNA